MRVRLLADDLTGALDTGAEFARAVGGLQVFWHGGLPAVLPDSAAIDSGTREAEAGSARATVRRLTPLLAGGGLAFKKLDSLMRGATVAELAACVAAGPWRACVLAPAFPFQGRVTRGAQQFARIDGAWRPAGPNLVDALRHEGVAARAARLGEALSPGINVFDAETDAELAAIAAEAPAEALFAGTGGLAAALAGERATATPVLPRPILGLFGSDQAATEAQLAACGGYRVILGGDRALPAPLGDVALLSLALPPGLTRADAAARIADGLHRAARDAGRPGTLLVAGGETLRALCLALRATHLALEGRILPGLPRSVLRGGAWDGVTVVSKSGAFGPPGLLRDLLAANEIEFERR